MAHRVTTVLYVIRVHLSNAITMIRLWIDAVQSYIVLE